MSGLRQGRFRPISERQGEAGTKHTSQEELQPMWSRIVICGMKRVDRRHCAGVAVGEPPVLGTLGYLAVLGAAVGGYAGLELWIIAAAAIALASVSRAQYSELYEPGRDIGSDRIVNSVMIRSLSNALVASSIAYAGGWALRLM